MATFISVYPEPPVFVIKDIKCRSRINHDAIRIDSTDPEWIELLTRKILNRKVKRTIKAGTQFSWGIVL